MQINNLYSIIHRASKIFLIAVLLLAINCNLTTAIALHCRFEVIRTSGEEIYACSATLLLETRSSEQISAIYGTHQTGKENENVLGLTIVSQSMEFFPTNIEEFFPNIEAIDFSNNSISSVSNNNLIPFANLWHLSLAKNRISTLDSKLFFGSNSLRNLFLQENSITSLDSNLFVGLHSQIFINLSNNTIKHVGHDFILPKLANIWFYDNNCIDVAFHAFSDDIVEEFRFDLLMKCPPTISLIESTLENRPNFIKDLIDRVRVLETIIENNNGIKIDKQQINGN